MTQAQWWLLGAIGLGLAIGLYLVFFARRNVIDGLTPGPRIDRNRRGKVTL